MRNPICKNCTFYTAYYKQWASGFGRLTSGYCSKQDITLSQSQTCELFKSNEKKEKMRENLRLDALERAIVSINEIAQILKERKNESDN